jgi:hypothetical protein
MQVTIDELSLRAMQDLSAAVWALVTALEKSAHPLVTTPPDKEDKDGSSKVEGVQDQG